MVTAAQVQLALRKGDWMASLDLEDAYWHVPIQTCFRRFLPFQEELSSSLPGFLLASRLPLASL